jgi:protein gp37
MQKTKIDWADMTWNPVTGCYHGCEYCYARKIAQRFADPYVVGYDGLYVLSDKASGYVVNPKRADDGRIFIAQKMPIFQNDGILKLNGKAVSAYPFGFCPTLHTHRLADPQKIKKPQTIFVCSMADLFGEWVPDEWIHTVFKACEAAPQHRYLFLTKNPKRYSVVRTNVYADISVSWSIHNNIWLGASATNQAQYYNVASALEDADQALYTFISIEPILEPIKITEIDCVANWVIIGAETGNRKGKVIPQKAWIDDIVQDCRKQSIPVFMKESLRELMGADFIQQYPWEVK